MVNDLLMSPFVLYRGDRRSSTTVDSVGDIVSLLPPEQEGGGRVLEVGVLEKRGRRWG